MGEGEALQELAIQVDEELWPWQSEYLGVSPDSDFFWIPNHNFAKCGTKAGKTMGCALGIFLRWLNTPHSRWCWTAPVNRQLEPTWQMYFRPLLQSIPKSLLRVRDAYGLWQAELKPTDSLLTLKSGEDPWNLRSDMFNGAVIDEAAHYPLESYYSILTNLTATNGLLWAISTPKAMIRKAGMSWFDAGFAEGMRQMQLPPEQRTHRAFRVTTESNPKPEIQKWVAMIRKMAENGTLPGGMTHFRREYLAEDVEGDSAVFRHISDLHTETPEGAKEGGRYALGWDPAARQDASVISIWDKADKREVHLEYMMAVPFQNQMQRLLMLYKRYNKPRGRVDATSLGGELVAQEMKKNLLPFKPIKFNQHTKTQYVTTLALACEREEPRFLDEPIARAEMEAYGYEVLPSGVVRYCAPQGQRDDCVTARMLAWMEVSKGLIQVF